MLQLRPLSTVAHKLWPIFFLCGFWALILYRRRTMKTSLFVPVGNKLMLNNDFNSWTNRQEQLLGFSVDLQDFL